MHGEGMAENPGFSGRMHLEKQRSEATEQAVVCRSRFEYPGVQLLVWPCRSVATSKPDGRRTADVLLL